MFARFDSSLKTLSFLLFQFQCDVPGLCLGHKLNYGKVADQGECEANCYANDACTW